MTRSVLRHRERGHQQIRCADAAVGAVGEWRDGQLVERGCQFDWRESHHRAAGSVERARDGVRHAGVDRGTCGGAELFDRRHRLDPDHVGATGDQRVDLLAKDRHRVVLAERAEGLEQLAGGSDGSRDDDRVRCVVGELRDAPFGAVQPEPAAGSAERVGEDDLGPGVHEALMQFHDAFRVLRVPQLRRVAGFEAHAEVVGPGGAVGQHGLAALEKLRQRGPHALDAITPPCPRRPAHEPA
jgi:hypothetical protein